MVDDHRVGNKKRVLAVVKKQLSPVTYTVEVPPNIAWKRRERGGGMFGGELEQ